LPDEIFEMSDISDMGFEGVSNSTSLELDIIIRLDLEIAHTLA
jgi:hypothetical protein